MKMNLGNRKSTAKIAGIFFLLWIGIGFYDMFFVSPKIFIEGNFSQSAQNILTHEFLFRTSIFAGLITNAVWIVLALLFYSLFKQVSEYQARLLVSFVLVQIPISIIIAGLNLTALMTMKNEVLTSFGIVQKQDLAILFTKISNYMVIAIELFWGLWLFPLAYLINKSDFIPKLFGVWLYFNGIVYVILCFTSLVVPQYKNIVFNFGMPAMFGELAFMFWLLLKGVKTNRADTGRNI